jgi:hypothetical protein
MPLVEIAMGIGQKAATSAIVTLLRDLIGVQDQQLQALRAIRQDVRTLLEGPWRESRQLLDMAAHSDGSVRHGYLLEARGALFRAHSHEPEATPRRATVAVDLAMVLGLLGERDGSVRWARNAFDDQVKSIATALPQVLGVLNSPVPALKVLVDGDFWELVNRSLKSDPEGARVWLRERYELGLDEAEPSSELSLPLAPGTWAARREGVRQLLRGLSGIRGAAAANEQIQLWIADSRSRVQRGEAPRPWGTKMSHIAIAGTTTEAGRQLMRLHRMRRDVREYRRVCLALDPTLDLPEWELMVDLSRTRRASIRWEVSPAR